ncbi:MAG TPA: hypothetical protein VG742_20940, partial [Dongiaceae bacterium]|nr:hypothetical protein [Dongiaceae bacterium]
MPTDLIKARFSGFADIRDRLGLRTIRQDGNENQFGACLEGPRFSLYFLHDRVDHQVSIALPGGRKSYFIGAVLQELGLWNQSSSIRDEIELAHVFEANIDRVLAALEDEAFLEAPSPDTNTTYVPQTESPSSLGA